MEQEITAISTNFDNVLNKLQGIYSESLNSTDILVVMDKLLDVGHFFSQMKNIASSTLNSNATNKPKNDVNGELMRQIAVLQSSLHLKEIQIQELKAASASASAVAGTGSCTQQKKLTIQLKPIECPICLESCGVSNRIKTKCCSHYFHESCIIEWFKDKLTCPYCRGNKANC